MALQPSGTSFAWKFHSDFSQVSKECQMTEPCSESNILPANQPKLPSFRRSCWPAVVNSLLILVLGVGIGWSGERLWQIAQPPAVVLDPNAGLLSDKRVENANKNAQERKIVERQMRIVRLKELASSYKERLRRMYQARSELAKAIGSGENSVIALKQQMARKQLDLAQQELLQVESDCRKKDVELKMLKANAAADQDKLTLLTDQLRFLKEFRTTLQSEVTRLAPEAETLTARSLDMDSYRLEIEVAEARLRQLLEEINTAHEEEV
jgi:hypothetical protein